MNQKVNIPTPQELREIVSISGEIGGKDFEWNWDTVGMTNFERRKELLDELLINVPLGIAQSAPILTDVRTRDAYLRSLLDFVESGDLGTVELHISGLLNIAQMCKGQTRGSALVCWAGVSWMLGNSNPILAISLGETIEVVRENTLWKLLDMAFRYDVPSRVWTSSLKAVSLEACLAGMDNA